MQDVSLSFRWLQVLAVVQALICLGVVPILASQVLRFALVLLLVVQGVLAVLAAGALLFHYRFAVHIEFGLSLFVALVGLVSIVAVPVPSGMMRSTFMLIRWIALILCLPSVGAVLLCLLAPDLRRLLFHLP